MPRSEKQPNADALHTRTERTVDRTYRGGLPEPPRQRDLCSVRSSKECDGCGDAVSQEEREFEVGISQALTFRFYAECYNAWTTCSELRKAGYRVGR